MRRWLFPDLPERHGHLLVLLTVVTGMVDAVSFLGLGRVFVANMTGNVVFLGFTLGGYRTSDAWASLLAIAAFAVGAWTAGRLTRNLPVPTGRRARVFEVAVGTQTVLVGAALVVTLTFGHQQPAPRMAMIALLGFGEGLQMGTVRALAVPDLATNVITTTLTGLAADPPGPPSRRRLVSIVAMLFGAFVGAALHLHVAVWAALLAAMLLLALTTTLAFRQT